MKFTDDQQKIIDSRNQSLLVTAAAGSGKTAVLVQRILERITDKNHPIDIDHILCLTFTEAAAAEMKARLLKRINEKLSENPDDAHLQHQSVLVHRAFIMTIDAFCNYVVSNHFQEIDLEPGMRIMDSGEEKILRQKVIDDYFEEMYLLPEADESRKNFIMAIESLSERGDDSVLKELIFKITDSSSSFPYPNEWLENALDQYREVSNGKAKWLDGLNKRVLADMEEALALLGKALDICSDISHESGLKSIQAYYDDIDTAYQKAIKQKDSFDSLNALSDFFSNNPRGSFGRFTKKKEYPEESETIASLRKNADGIISDLAGGFFKFSFKSAIKTMEEMTPLVEAIVSISKNYTKRFEEEKKNASLMSFNDCEHYALNILTKKVGEKYIPTETAEELADFFEEVMCDEYQDSNEIQEALLNAVSRERRGEYNRFMVGDVKQSIYRFRKANPGLIMSKMAEYKESGDKRRIDLSANFRSRSNVLDSCNQIFEKIMRPEFGGIAYDERAKLYFGATDYSDENTGLLTELHILNRLKKDETEDNKYYQQAKLIAKIIKENIGKTMISDKAENEGEKRPLRKAEYKDVAILLRNLAMSNELVNVFKEEGIPLYVTTSKGYYDSPEVITLLSFLEVIENPRRDLSLYRTLSSPFFEFSDEELAYIKAGSSNECSCFYDRVMEFSDPNGNELEQKCNSFVEVLRSYRTLSFYEPVSSIISRIIEDTGFASFVLSMPNGDQRVRNIDLFLDKARSFEKNGDGGLFRFIDYINLAVNEFGDDMGPASVIDEDANMVKVYTIHKSKGLEFPICIVADLDHGFNMTDTKESFLMDSKYGLACKFFSPEKRVKKKTLLHKFFADRESCETKAEELRLLYVAATRAKEKLIFVGAVDPKKDDLENGLSAGEERFNENSALLSHRIEDKLFPVSYIRKCNNLLGFVMLGLCDDKTVLKTWNYYDIEEKTVEEKIDIASRREQLPEIIAQNEKKDEAIRELSKRFSLTYSHMELEGLFTKTSVSELKKSAYVKETGESKEDAKPLIKNHEDNAGTEYGTAHHRVMELLDLSSVAEKSTDEDAIKDIKAQVDNMVAEGYMPSSYRELINVKKILAFIKTNSGSKMTLAEKNGTLQREAQFFLGIPASLLRDEFPDDETLLVQGIIDVYWEDEDGLVILDYKTDRISDGQELIDRYETQMFYYKKALEEATGKKVKECILYSFCLEKEVVITDPKEKSNI